VFSAANPTPQEFPEVTASIPDGYLLTGGGAFANWRGGAGNMLTASGLAGNNGWYAASKSHGPGDSIILSAYAIGIQTKF
jgi:hypothetical protein